MHEFSDSILKCTPFHRLQSVSLSIFFSEPVPLGLELLERLGFTVKVIAPSIDEIRMEGETAENFAKRMARAKCLAVVNRMAQSLYADPSEGPARRPTPAPRGSPSRAAAPRRPESRRSSPSFLPSILTPSLPSILTQK